MNLQHPFHRLTICFTTIAIGLIATNVTNADQIQADSRVTDVTLYRSQAQVTRALQVANDVGPLEIVVGELPENIVPDSLFAEAGDNVEVRAVQFRTRAVGSSPREEVRNLETEIRTAQMKIDLNAKQTNLLAKQSTYLDSLEHFVAPTATTELSNGVLDAEALERITKFNFQQREDIAKREIELSSELYELQQQLNLLNRKLAEITNGASKTVREAILFVQKNGDQPCSVRLNYLVNSCGWSPNYTLRADGDRSNTRLEYNGLIQQMSGEDWQDVKLTLSTATPALSASGPGLAPFKLSLIPIGDANQQLAQSVSNAAAQTMDSQLETYYSKKRDAIFAVQNSINFKDNFSNSWGLNDTINALACVELVSQPSTAGSLSSQLGDTSQPSVSYQLGSKVSLTSRNSQQMVRIMQTDLPSEFYHVATPILTSYVFREADLNNNSPEDLLAGPITVYLDGRFVGRGEIPSVARGQTFVVGFGADSQLRTRRELVDKVSEVNGGNQEITLNYRLVIENYKDTPVNIRVIDRLPTSAKDSEIRITLANPDQQLSADKVYQRLERPQGILRWDTDVPARSVGEKIYEIAYGFSLEFDRKYQVAVAGDRAEQQQKFEELQNQRIKR